MQNFLAHSLPRRAEEEKKEVAREREGDEERRVHH
jgi:hypothetical protein